MGIIKVIGSGANLDENLNGTNFNGSDTIFTFGSYAVQSNFSGRIPIDYTNALSSFVRPITLETLSISELQSNQILDYTKNAVLNLDKTDLRSYVRFGSTHELFRVTLQNIIIGYPASLYANPQVILGGNYTYYDYAYDIISDTCEFKIPIKTGSNDIVINNFGLVYNQGNLSIPDDIALKNLNLSFEKYLVWTTNNPTDNTHKIIGFTGFSTSSINPFMRIVATGDAFPFMSGASTGKINIHLKPNQQVFEEYRTLLSNFERYFILDRVGTEGFNIMLKNPTLLDNGGVSYNDTILTWTTSDGYNVDFNTPTYNAFQNNLFGIGDRYDSIKTDLIARFLTPASLKVYDLTTEGKMTKLLRIYGREFDELRQFIDGLVYVNTTTYDKKNNLPDQIVKNLARTFGWDVFTLVSEEQFVDSILSLQQAEESNRLTPAEVDIELWRRILINTNFYWKSKGTRNAIKSMFLLMGIPEPFIDITEYIYTVDGKIDPRNVEFNLADLPSTIYTNRGDLIPNSLPFDAYGYPSAPIQSPKFYFQISGDSDSGQAYMDVFRNVGFQLNRTVDNKKSWVEAGSVDRSHYSTLKYYQEDSQLILNTKEVGISLDTARGIEYDVYTYIKDIDFPANSSGYTMPYSFVNIAPSYSGVQSTFVIPANIESGNDVEVFYNGIQLISQNEYTGGTYTRGNAAQYDYTLTGVNNNIVTLEGSYGSWSVDHANGDVIEITYVYKIGTTTGSASAKYLVSQVKPKPDNTAIILLPEVPNGDVQLSINGALMTKSTPTFMDGDFTTDPNNPLQLVIQNPAITAFFATNPFIQVSYLTITGNLPIIGRTETKRVDSFCSSKLFIDKNANKYVYKLNYKVVNIENVRIVLNGVVLTPGLDYTSNPSNPYEIYLPTGINYGDILSAYYIVGGNDLFNPIVDDAFGLGDITNLSFLEFIDLIQKRLINAKTRKIITDFKGGFYPALLSLYTKYLKRSILPVNDPLHTNGYTFQNLYPFINKYNAYFQRFVDELLSSTIILRKSGLLIRNTVFTRQKFMYRRGVSFDPFISFNGDNGTLYVKRINSQTSFWTEDRVCQDISCEDFNVTNILITYPTSTTSTTAPTTTTTTASPVFISVTTGTVSNLGVDEMRVINNVINNPQGNDIFEYGILYTQNPLYNNDANLRFVGLNLPAQISKVFDDASGSINPTTLSYFTDTSKKLIGLTPNTNTYFRAYHKRGGVITYGIVKSQITNEVVDVFETTVSLVPYSVVTPPSTEGSIKLISFDLKFTPPLPEGKVAQITLKYTGIRQQNSSNSPLGSYENNLNVELKKNTVNVATYNSDYTVKGVQVINVPQITPIISVNNTDTVNGVIYSNVYVQLEGSAYDGKSSNYMKVSLNSATINSGLISMDTNLIIMNNVYITDDNPE